MNIKFRLLAAALFALALSLPSAAPAAAQTINADQRGEIERIVREVPLPLNVIAFPGAPDKNIWAEAGVARISHGPFPHRALMKQFEGMARAAIS